MSKIRSWGLTVVTMVSVATVVMLVTGWGSALASSLSTSVIVANPAANPAKVHETNTDATGNIKVHEQGIAKVAVQNQDAAGNVKVHEQGTANVHVTNAVSVQNFPATQAVSGSVNVSNLPAAPTTQVIDNGTRGPIGSLGYFSMGTPYDLSAYRSVTLYLTLSAGTGSGQYCSVTTYDPDNNSYVLDSFSTGTNTEYSTTLDPAPPNVLFICQNDAGQSVTTDFMLTGRTG